MRSAREIATGRVPALLALAAAAVCATALPSTEAGRAGTGLRQDCSGWHWVGAWGASPTDAATGVSQPLSGQTVRNIVTPLGGGAHLRFRFSNALSEAPLEIATASVGRRRTGAAVRPSSIRLIKFSGRRRVTIPPGRQVISGPVSLRVRPFQRLAVSTHIAPGSDATVTEHHRARQTSYLSEAGTGNHALDPTGQGFVEKTTRRFVLSGIDMRKPHTVSAVVAFGDSLTDGSQGNRGPGVENPAGLDLDVRYPDFLARRILRSPGPAAFTVLNAGISGNRILREGQLPQYGPSGLARLRRDIIRQSGVGTVVVLEGINDLAQTPQATAPAVIEGLREIVARVQARGLQVLLGTLPPAGGATSPSYASDEVEAMRTAVNAWIRIQGLADAIADFDRALRDPADPSRIRPEYAGRDGLHPNIAGYRAKAGAVPLRDLARGACR